MNKNNSRYPYTYAADYIRWLVENPDGSPISRSTASQIQEVIAEAIGMDRVKLSETLANNYIEKAHLLLNSDKSRNI